ncbi:dioxygenase [Kosmotoga arenicorallina S304]|uniref:MEMO1 family protein AT15_04905 n=1 Tax=Kosmotoga arenicorallina S304 TaxID=1453497 RepID=A0A176JWG2_9BACT|nr:AmmeMemoRadiSam system protein B [Kosmotoga arenicorallina]OAA28026.1 dioxygenase [Kosmotoga arenicorallina S304]
MFRSAIFSGRFYAGFPEELKSQIEACFLHKIGPGELPGSVVRELDSNVGLISPHAGYIYSGPVAAKGYYEIAKLGKPRRVILIGPNHSGYGKRLSVWPSGEWSTPLGTLKIDEEFTNALVNSMEYLSFDTSAHLYEHSLEVQLPFLQYLFGDDFKIVTITMMDQRYEVSKRLAESIRGLMNEAGTLIIASSDLNHYEDHETTLKKDNFLIEHITKLDAKGLYEEATAKRISACGLGAISTVMMLFGNVSVEKHATSGETSGDYSHTVGYLSAVLT